ncbi:MAG: DMT family transporter [Candidatus Eremiobacteraeota bacterium]|nr:DMT family transporter [Candidatus Eremiobacteraeota bacterium]
MPTAEKHRALPALVLLSAIWGYNWVVMKGAMVGLGPLTFGALRTGLGALLLVAYFGATRTRLRLQAPGGVALLGLLQTTAFVTFSSMAIATGGVGKAAVLIYTMPFWTIVLAWLVLRERPRELQWLAIAMGLVGLIFVLYPLDLKHQLASKLYASVGGFFWAGSMVYAKWFRPRVALDLPSLTTWQMIFGAIPLVLAAAFAHEMTPHWTPYVIFAVAYNAVLGTAIGWLLWLYVVGKLPVGVAGVASLAIPLIGVGTAWLQLGEVPSPSELVGVAFISAALGTLALQGQFDARRARFAALQPAVEA